MKVRIHKRSEDDRAVLVDWKFFEPYWLRSTFAPVNRDELINCYSALWFKKANKPLSFILGEISFRKDESGDWVIVFSNGRNRTNVLIKHQSMIPIAIVGEIPHSLELHNAIVRELVEGDEIEIAELPICSMDEIREAMRRQN